MSPSTICFVCQKGRLESQAVLLAASLRRHFPPTTRLVAAHPERLGALHRETLAAFERLNVAVRTIENPLHASYPIGHKLAALPLLEDSELGIFLDSDILTMAPPGELPETLAAVPATRRHCPTQEWEHLYRKFDLPLPAPDFSTLNGERGFPYFNSGMIAVPGALAAALAASWIDTARRIDADAFVSRRSKSPWLDQLSLPIAAARLGVTIAPLEARWNYPSWIWRIGERPSPVFFHYQKIARLRRERITFEAAQAAAAPHLLPLLRGSWIARWRARTPYFADRM